MDMSLKEKFERRVHVRSVDRVGSGAPARYVLSAERGVPKPVSAAEALARRGLTLLHAKRVVESLIGGATSAVMLPTVEDAVAFERDMADCGVTAQR